MSGNTIKPGPRAVAALVLAGGSTLALPFLQRHPGSESNRTAQTTPTETAGKLSGSQNVAPASESADAASRSEARQSAKHFPGHRAMAVTGALPSTRR
ncbi:MAG TPA: hypothetical protein DDW52_17610, partial [Planctomycetaceae bacterium]|nr:hypothetical protein [Planctomycetaceae bacterium]